MCKRFWSLAALASSLCVVCAGGDVPKPADNSYCLVCHVNFKTEKLSVGHQKNGIGCMTCHGESDRHSADEDGLTPPQIMFAKEKINAACGQCHAEAKLRAKDAHAPLFDKSSAKIQTCTECHGEHRMAARTRHWDKHTGKLIADDGVRMMQKNSAATSAR